MRFIILTFLLVLCFVTYGQEDVNTMIIYSPDKNSEILLSATPLSDANIEWKYQLISTKKDTTLLTTAITHDESPPVAYWTKTSEAVILEHQKFENSDNKIVIYNVKNSKIEFETPGFVWGSGASNFDQSRGLLFFFRRVNSEGRYDLLVLDTETKKIKNLTHVITSGDSITGLPEIVFLDKVKRQLTILFETKNGQPETKKVDYNDM
jgi:hypothetical protein